ncbi:MAG: wax ester/triacylglycerol synthase family O-acyltransferase [Halioglobus sp.]|jgi:WS/DGAT/MGAT family acyltransferase|nr:wax ester/triacylglycerol synthase family O-acyltransferase [Halioglobus sp.]
MHRLSGQDASFLYTETPTVLMHTIKVQIFESPYRETDYGILRERLEAALDVVPMLRQKVLFVPFNLHHPVMVDDPDFDLDAHIYRAALPAPGGMRELHDMISQIMCHRLDRSRPLWELWMLTGLENGRSAIVHKVHHCLADGAATVRYLGRVFEQQASLLAPRKLHAHWQPEPLPGAGRLVGDALRDHIKIDMQRFPAFLSALWQTGARLLAFHRDVGSPSLQRLAHPPPRTRLNHALSPRRSFTTRQIPVQEAKAVARILGGTINDLILALAANAVRDYLLLHHELPSEPLCTAIPVSADEPGSVRAEGNRTTYLPTCLWTNIADPLERFQAIQRATQVAKRELDLLGKDTFIELMHFLPPFFSLWKASLRQYLRQAERADYRPLTNVIISNVQGPAERLSGNYGALVDLYSMGPLVEGCGLNITVWSYAGNLNFSLMGCKRAVPDIERLGDGLLAAMAGLRQLCAEKEVGQ